MRILATNNFNNKLNLFTDESVKNKLASIIEQLEFSGNITLLTESSHLSVDNVYVYKVGEYRIFFTIEHGDVIFADIIKKESQVIRISNKNPKTNTSINPQINTSINPNFNSSLNPKFNSSINPVFNNLINPNFNNSINPIYNNLINPNYNTTINPQYNTSLNPNYNTLINPQMNPSFDGLFLFDLDGNSYFFIVIANNDVILIYENNNVIQNFGVRWGIGFSIFDFETKRYQSFLVSDGQNGYNHFDLNNEWIGYAR